MMEKFFDVSSVVSTEEFEELIETYFRPYMTSPGSFNWQALLDFVKYNERQLLYLGTERNLLQFLEFFLQLLDKFECHDASLMNRLLDLYSYLEKYPNSIERHYWEIYSKVAREDVSKRLVSCVLRHLNHTDNFDLCPKVDFARVCSAINAGNISLMKALVKNGFSYLPPENCLKFVSPFRLRMFFDCIQSADLTMSNILSEKREYMENLNTDVLFENCLRSCKGRFQRLALLVIAVEALFYRSIDIKFLRRYVKCFRLFYRTISEPFLTLQEMKEFFAIIFNGLDTEDVVQRFIGELKEMYPELDRHYEPRNLLQLCRVRIRLDAIESRETVPKFLSRWKTPAGVKAIILAVGE